MSMNHLVVYASGKGTDENRGQIDSIIYRLSCQSTYFKEQQRKDAATDARIAKMKETVSKSPPLPQSSRLEIDELVTKYRNTRRKRSSHVVVDMDAFYFSCHLADQKERGNTDCLIEYPKGSGKMRKLVDVPAAVGGGVISTSNYAARKYGVRSAMAGFIADQLVKELGINGDTELHWVERAKEGNYELYRRKSNEVRKILLQYDPNLKCYSLDECFMNMEMYLQMRFGRNMSHESIQLEWAKMEEESREQDDGEEEEETDDQEYNLANNPKEYAQRVQDVVQEMRLAVEKATFLTCSAGIAPNSTLAKIASDQNKPNGQCFVPAGDDSVMVFLKNLSTRKMGGIGRVSQKILSAFDINTLGELFEKRHLVHQIFGEKSASFLLRASLGWNDDDGADTVEDGGVVGGQKSASCENTFRATQSLTVLTEYLRQVVLTLTDKYMVKKDRGRLKGKTVTLRVKLSDYQRYCRSKTLGFAVSTFSEIFPVAEKMLREASVDERMKRNSKFEVRLLGVAVSNFVQEVDGGEKQQTLLGLWKRPPTTATTTKNEDGAQEDDTALIDDTVADGDEELLLSQGTEGGDDDQENTDASLKLAQDLQRAYTEEIQRRLKEEESSRKLAEQLDKEERKNARISELFQKFGSSPPSKRRGKNISEGKIVSFFKKVKKN